MYCQMVKAVVVTFMESKILLASECINLKISYTEKLVDSNAIM